MKDYIRHQRGRMFDSDFFEMFSKVHPSTPFILYIPAGLLALGWAFVNHVTSLEVTAVFFPLGWLTWQLMEYFIHKKLFHWEGNGPFTRKMHDIVHGFHHKYPDDDTRLVMPLGASLPLVGIVGALLYTAHRPDLTVPYLIGMLFGYLWYDFIHWSTHYREPWTAWGREQRTHHMAHHFADINSNFGISHRWVDRVMGTLMKRPGAKT